MALNIPQNRPLTDSQKEVKAKIGSMKNILALPFRDNRNIPKSRQISLFDYSLQLMDSLGIDQQFVFNSFLEKVLDKTNILEENVVSSTASSLARKGVKLPDTSPVTNDPRDDQIESFKQNNERFLSNNISSSFIDKKQLSRELTLMLFGDRNGSSSSNMNISQNRRDDLINEAVCGVNTFSISSEPSERNEDVEFNKIDLRKQLEKGEVKYEINCNEVNIQLPEDPGTVLDRRDDGVISSSSVTPAQSLQKLTKFVGNEARSIAGENNQNSVGKTFGRTLVEKFVNYINTLVIPYVDTITALINNSKPSNSPSISRSDIAVANCELSNDPNNPEKKEFTKKMANNLLTELLSIMVVTILKEFKTLVANYFARTAIERQKRKAQKMLMKFQIFSQVGENASKAQKFASALQTLSPILGNETQNLV